MLDRIRRGILRKKKNSFGVNTQRERVMGYIVISSVIKFLSIQLEVEYGKYIDLPLLLASSAMKCKFYYNGL